MGEGGKQKKNEQNIFNLWNKFKLPDIHLIGVHKEEERS